MVIPQYIKPYLPIIGILLLTLIFGILTINMQRLFPQNNAVISGVFTLNGVIPPGSTLTLFSREAGSQAPFMIIATNITPKDLATWQYKNTVSGKMYEIKAGLVVNGIPQIYSNTITLTSPNVNGILLFNMPMQTPVGKANIAGNVIITGYIPAHAMVVVEATTSGKTTYIPIASLPANSQVSFQYSGAIAGQGYMTKAILFTVNLANIGETSVQTIVAPAVDQKYTITSLANPPITPTPVTKSPTPSFSPSLIPTPIATTSPTPLLSLPASMSGTIQFTGQAPLNSRIVLFERPTGTTDFQLAVDNLPPTNGVTWFWNDGFSGTSYDLIAILKQKQSNGTDMDISDSSIVTLTPPVATGQLTINSTYTLPAPSPNISLACGNLDGSSLTWGASVSFQTITGAQSYWFEIGTTDGGTDLINLTQNATNGTNQIITAGLKNGTTYYAKYAYSSAANLPAGSTQFSTLSSTVQLKCTQ